MYLIRNRNREQHLVRRIRFKTKFFEDANVAAEDYDTYGFKTKRSPKPVNYLQTFEENLIKMVQNVELRTTRSRFQTELLKVVRDVSRCKNLIIPSDKTANFYEVSVGDYRKSLNDGITKFCVHLSKLCRYLFVCLKSS